MRKFLVFLVVLAVFLAIRDWQQRPVVHEPGVLVGLEPRQENLRESPPISLDEFILTPRAEFDIQARVLGTEKYVLGTEAKLSPVDLALGWNRMSDQAVVDQISIRQSGRWYYTRFDLPPPIPSQEISRSSANMHMIPANDGIKRELKSIRKGEVIRIQGYLVDVDHESGWQWRTSMTRNDTGQGACELVYVEDVMRLTEL